MFYMFSQMTMTLYWLIPANGYFFPHFIPFVSPRSGAPSCFASFVLKTKIRLDEEWVSREPIKPAISLIISGLINMPRDEAERDGRTMDGAAESHVLS